MSKYPKPAEFLEGLAEWKETDEKGSVAGYVRKNEWPKGTIGKYVDDWKKKVPGFKIRYNELVHGDSLVRDETALDSVSHLVERFFEYLMRDAPLGTVSDALAKVEKDFGETFTPDLIDRCAVPENPEFYARYYSWKKMVHDALWQRQMKAALGDEENGVDPDLVAGRKLMRELMSGMETPPSPVGAKSEKASSATLIQFNIGNKEEADGEVLEIQSG